MKRFALITHLLGSDSELNYVFYPPLKTLEKFFSKKIANKILYYLPPCKMSEVEEICSLSNSKTSGCIITVPFFPLHLAKKGEKALVGKVLSGCKLASKLGADIIGLAAFTSVVGDEGVTVSKYVGTAITSGNTYTAALAIDSLLKASKKLRIDFSSARLSIIGAAGDIGSVCAKSLANVFKNITLVGRDKKKLKSLAEVISINSNISVETNIKSCIRYSDLILCVASSVFPLFNVNDFKPGAVVCDVSIPPAIEKSKENFRTDVLIYDGGKAKINFLSVIYSKEWKILFPDNVVFGCLAETILLALEEKIENFSLGRGNISLEKLGIISKIAQKHGFETAPFKFGNYYYTDEDMERIKNSRNNI